MCRGLENISACVLFGVVVNLQVSRLTWNPPRQQAAVASSELPHNNGCMLVSGFRVTRDTISDVLYILVSASAVLEYVFLSASYPPLPFLLPAFAVNCYIETFPLVKMALAGQNLYGRPWLSLLTRTHAKQSCVM
jgi:hypothetical protein